MCSAFRSPIALSRRTCRTRLPAPGCWPAWRRFGRRSARSSRMLATRADKLAGQLRRDGWQLRVFKRRQRVFAIAGLTWIVERSFAWLGFNRRLAKDYERRVQTSETLIDIAAIRL